MSEAGGYHGGEHHLPLALWATRALYWVETVITRDVWVCHECFPMRLGGTRRFQSPIVDPNADERQVNPGTPESLSNIDQFVK
jgi:hypothetical protein